VVKDKRYYGGFHQIVNGVADEKFLCGINNCEGILVNFKSFRDHCRKKHSMRISAIDPEWKGLTKVERQRIYQQQYSEKIKPKRRRTKQRAQGGKKEQKTDEDSIRTGTEDMDNNDDDSDDDDYVDDNDDRAQVVLRRSCRRRTGE
jgi:hypothetical protein